MFVEVIVCKVSVVFFETQCTTFFLNTVYKQTLAVYLWYLAVMTPIPYVLYCYHLHRPIATST